MQMKNTKYPKTKHFFGEKIENYLQPARRFYLGQARDLIDNNNNFETIQFSGVGNSIEYIIEGRSRGVGTMTALDLNGPTGGPQIDGNVESFFSAVALKIKEKGKFYT